jgi:NADH-ubiquinone oxidoreductase chain 6
MALSTGLTAPSFWFSYILFLVFLGGILVLFIYVASLASNEIFRFSTKLFFIITSLLGLITITVLLLDPSNIPTINHLYENSSWPVINDILNIFIFKIYGVTNYLLTLLAVIYLLLALIIVANIVSVQEGPLRPLT